MDCYSLFYTSKKKQDAGMARRMKRTAADLPEFLLFGQIKLGKIPVQSMLQKTLSCLPGDNPSYKTCWVYLDFPIERSWGHISTQ